MSNVTIGRYDGPTDSWSGWIEGEDSTGKSWIMYLDGSGRPSLFWPERTDTGATVDEPVAL